MDSIGAQTNEFVGDYPDFVAIQKQEGTLAMILAFLGVATDQLVEVLLTTMWTFPIVIMMSTDTYLADLLDSTDKLQEERLCDAAHIAIVRPELLTNLQDALVAQSMLRTLNYTVKRQYDVLKKKSIQKQILEYLSKAEGSPVLAADLEQMREGITNDIILVCQIEAEVVSRIATLQQDIDSADREQLDEVEVTRRSRREFMKRKRDEEKELERKVETLTMPRRIHTLSLEHSRLTTAFDGRLYGYKVGPFGSLVRSLKLTVFGAYCVNDMGTLNTNLSRSQMVKLRQISLTICLLYLLVCTFYIFLYSLQLEDNSVVSSILTSLAMSNGIEIIVTGPLSLIVSAGLLPWLALTLVREDMRNWFIAQKQQSSEKTDLPDVEVELTEIFDSEKNDNNESVYSNPLADPSATVTDKEWDLPPKPPGYHEGWGVEPMAIYAGSRFDRYDEI